MFLKDLGDATRTIDETVLLLAVPLPGPKTADRATDIQTGDKVCVYSISIVFMVECE